MGVDTTEAWRIFSETTSALANMRQSERLLGALYQADQGDWGAVLAALLDADLGNRIPFKPGEVIHTQRAASADCYVVESGLASLRFEDAEGVELGMVGSGGIIGGASALLLDVLPITAVATTPCRVARIPMEGFSRRLLSADHGLEFLHATIAYQWAQTAILARCNAEHSVQERVARWTLTAHQHVDRPIGPISHDRLASLLGVRRASVTVALGELEGDGAIRSMRTFIEVRDEAALERLSCECGALLAGLTRQRMAVRRTPQRPQQP